MLMDLEKISHQSNYTQVFEVNHFKILGKDLAPHNIVKTVIVHFNKDQFLYTLVTRHSKDQRFKGTEQIKSTVFQGKPYRNQVQNLHIVSANSVAQASEVFKLFPLFQKLNLGFNSKLTDSKLSVKVPKFQYLTIHSRIPENFTNEIKGLKQLRCLGCFDAPLIQNNGNTLKDLAIYQPFENLVNLDFQIKSQLNVLKVIDGNELRCSNFLKNQQKMTECILSSCTLDFTEAEKLDFQKRNCDLKNFDFKIKFP